MIVVPFRYSPDHYSVFIVFDAESLDRIKSYDPAEFCVPKLGAPWNTMVLRDVIIGFGTKEEIEQLQVPGCNAPRLLRNLSRGWKFRPELGDNDNPYEKVIHESRPPRTVDEVPGNGDAGASQ